MIPKRCSLLCKRAKKKNNPEKSDNDEFGWWFFGLAVDLIGVDAHIHVIIQCF
jgi:hypothetical protein